MRTQVLQINLNSTHDHRVVPVQLVAGTFTTQRNVPDILRRNRRREEDRELPLVGTSWDRHVIRAVVDQDPQPRRVGGVGPRRRGRHRKLLVQVHHVRGSLDVVVEVGREPADCQIKLSNIVESEISSE